MSYIFYVMLQQNCTQNLDAVLPNMNFVIFTFLQKDKRVTKNDIAHLDILCK